MDLKKEELAATELLKDKVIDIVLRHNKDEVIIKFKDGTTFFINKTEDGLDLSIT